LDWAAATLPPGLALQGNLDPIALVGGGPGLTTEAERIVGALSQRAHIFNLGHGVLPETDPAHVEALITTLRNARTTQT
jgi:uroporphyrinogen decarboxylase